MFFIDMVVPLCLLSFFRIFESISRSQRFLRGDDWWIHFFIPSIVQLIYNTDIKNYDTECND